MRIKQLFLFLCGMAAILTAGEKIPLNHSTRDYNQLHIVLTLHFDFAEKAVYGTEKFTFSPLVDSFTVLRMHSLDTRILSVRDGLKSLKHEFRDSLLLIRFPQPLQKGKKKTITIEYVSLPGAGLYFFSPDSLIPDMPWQIWSQGQGNDNRHWFPAYDLPDDRHTTEFYITVKNGLQAFANGVLVSVKPAEDGGNTYHWKMEYSHANYLTTLVVGEFVVQKENVGKVHLEYGLPKGWERNGKTVFGATSAMLNMFSKYLGEYPYPRYAQFPVQDFLYGGMENVTATTLNRRVLHFPSARPNYSSDDLIAHEFAHQWFGDYLTCNTWDDIWLNEGFATYFTNTYAESRFGPDEGNLRGMQTMDAFKKWLDVDYKKTSVKPGKEIPAALQGEQAYSGGASVLRMLRFELGEELFKKGIRAYVKKFAHANVATEDFREVMERESGRDLQQFFDQWVYTAGYPSLRVSGEYDKTNKSMSYFFEQNDSLHPSKVYSIRLPIRISSLSRTFDTTIVIRDPTTKLKISLPSPPDYTVFNSRAAVLCDIRYEQSISELELQAVKEEEAVGRYLAVEKLLAKGQLSDSLRLSLLLREKSYKIRTLALHSSTGSNVLSAIVVNAGIKDSDARVRETAYRAAVTLPNDGTHGMMLQDYGKEANEYLRAAIAYTLTKKRLWNTDSVIAIERKKRTHRQILLRSIIEALGEIQDSCALKYCMEFVTYDAEGGDMHQLSQVALDYSAALYRTHPVRVTAILCRALENPYFRMRMSAASYLAKLGLTAYIDLLQKSAQKERRHRVRNSMQQSLELLKKY